MPTIGHAKIMILATDGFRTDRINADARWEDTPVMRDGNPITSRNSGDLDAFCAAVVDAVREDPEQRSAAE